MTDTHAVALIAAALILKQEGSFYDESAMANEAADLLVAANKVVKERAEQASETPLLSSMTPEWCVRTYNRVNPGSQSSPPSLYLVDFARAVVRHMEGLEM